MRIVLFALAVTMAAPALAQEDQAFTQQPRCWLGNMGYSPGSTIRAGNSVMVCTPELTWEETDRWAAGCVHNGRFYSAGAVENGPNVQAIKIECQPDGTWKQVGGAE